MFCGILEDYSSFCTRKRVVIKLLKFLNCINSSCLGYFFLEVAGRLLEELKKNIEEKFSVGFTLRKIRKKKFLRFY